VLKVFELEVGILSMVTDPQPRLGRDPLGFLKVKELVYAGPEKPCLNAGPPGRVDKAKPGIVGEWLN
jgi:hypothetical protein